MVKSQKIVLIGAGSLQFGLGSVGSILESKILEGATISLHDINAEALEMVRRICQAAIDERKLDFTLESSIFREDVLKNADFIINSIEIPPRFDLWEQDYQIPKQFGNKQIMGENGGPGGMFHSLRVIPPILDICEDVRKICPNALFINFSNPMSRVCLGIKRKVPNLKFVGLCHEIHFVRQHLPKILETPLSNLKIRAGGLNHFGVILEVIYKDSRRDAYPDLRKKGKSYLQKLNALDGNKLQLYIFDTYGYLPYTGDSHYGEYIHWAWEKADLIGVRRFYETYKLNTLNAGKKILRLIRKGKGARLVKPNEESAIPIIEGILSDAKYEEMSVNIPNDNIITNLPKDLVVECPAIVDKDGIHGITLGEYPRPLASLLRTQASVQDLVVEAILKNSKELALQALLADPVVDTATQAEQILEEMLKVQNTYINLD